MNKTFLIATCALALVACSTSSTPPAPSGAPAGPAAPAQAAGSPAELGKPAPDFTLVDLDGKTVKLGDHKGKTVVLEWFNPDCPFVKRNHLEGPLKDMAAKTASSGVVWLAINSGVAGKQGHGADTNKRGRDTYKMAHPILLDETGAVGKLYGAKRTPHMYVVDPQGTLVYKGAIDNAPDGDPTEGNEVKNHVAAALADLAANRPIALRETEAYGCSVKY